MKKKLITLAMLLATTPLLVQCASQNDIKNLNYQLRVVNKKIDDMKVGTVGQMQQRQAASSSQIDEMRREILSLKGQIDEMGHFNRQLKEQNKELENSLSQYSSTLQNEMQKERNALLEKERENNLKVTQLEEKLARNQETLKAIQQSRVKEAQLKANAAARAAEEARRRAEASNTTLASSTGGVINIRANKKKRVFSTASASTPQSSSTKAAPVKTDTTSVPVTDLLTSADTEYSNGNYQKAYKLYEQFGKKNPGSPKAVNARFMMGECLYFQKEYDQAILQYQKVISNNPSHPRAASALLKQGMAFESLADFETAKIIYKKIYSSYPSSPESAKAKDRSNKIN